MARSRVTFPRTASALAVLWLCCLAPAAPARAQGNFTVTEADVGKMKLIHYYGPDRRLRQVDFTFAFEPGTFVLRRGKAEIPADLVAGLLPDEPAKSSPAEITGSWTLKDGRLVLSHIKAGDTPGRKDATLTPYMTAARVVRIGHVPQYVFEVKE